MDDFVEFKNLSGKAEVAVVKNCKKKKVRNRYNFVFIVYLKASVRGSVQAALKSFFWIEEPKQELEYCN